MRVYSIGMGGFTREDILAKIAAGEHTVSIDMDVFTEFRIPAGTFELLELYEYPATWFGRKLRLR